MTVTGKMIHYLLLLGSLERSGMNRREEANTPATCDVDGDREGGKHLALVSLYRFIGCVLRDSHGRIE